MSGLIKVGIMLAVFAIVNYIIGVIRTYKLTKKFMLPNTAYFAGIFKASAYVVKALSGISPPGRMIERLDRYYYSPTYAEFYEALVAVHKMMVDTGWNIKDYKASAKDCEDYATKMAVEIRNYISNKFQDKVNGRGVSVGFIGYIIDKSGGHALVKAVLDSGTEYYQPFPDESFLKEVVLSKSELESIMLDIM